jgi:hypothetical protein
MTKNNFFRIVNTHHHVFFRFVNPSSSFCVVAAAAFFGSRAYAAAGEEEGLNNDEDRTLVKRLRSMEPDAENGDDNSLLRARRSNLYCAPQQNIEEDADDNSLLRARNNTWITAEEDSGGLVYGDDDDDSLVRARKYAASAPPLEVESRIQPKQSAPKRNFQHITGTGHDPRTLPRPMAFPEQHEQQASQSDSDEAGFQLFEHDEPELTTLFNSSTIIDGRPYSQNSSSDRSPLSKRRQRVVRSPRQALKEYQRMIQTEKQNTTRWRATAAMHEANYKNAVADLAAAEALKQSVLAIVRTAKEAGTTSQIWEETCAL